MDGTGREEALGVLGSDVGKDRRDGLTAMKMNKNLWLEGMWMWVATPGKDLA